ncbi:hypothetical protein [Desulfoscipio geothermicus]|uniref:Uncharacterized protein n=1 Tax=Desulfoscipio geothermicus DSM 3669 TaxID=1121426 RepID=A0A1I6DXN4_9FIRM|nr:hypothetical protein [Desulfoscipio geothermicus]SFR10091.1 hypothetical protein SAMN05660706_12034 [Desulfoscipio geothermicus DSM 3669]
MNTKKRNSFISQVQNRIDAEEIGEEVLRDAGKRKKDVADFQLNEAGGPLAEEFDEQD